MFDLPAKVSNERYLRNALNKFILLIVILTDLFTKKFLDFLAMTFLNNSNILKLCDLGK